MGKDAFRKCAFCGGKPNILFHSTGSKAGVFMLVECVACHAQSSDYCISSTYDHLDIYTAFTQMRNEWNDNNNNNNKPRRPADKQWVRGTCVK